MGDDIGEETIRGEECMTKLLLTFFINVELDRELELNDFDGNWNCQKWNYKKRIGLKLSISSLINAEHEMACLDLSQMISYPTLNRLCPG